jgi:hypothetical protein
MLNELLDRLRSLPLHGIALLTATALLSACGDSTGVGDPQRVALSFSVTTSASPALSTGSGPAAAPARVAGPAMSIEGSNGTLVIDEIRLIVAEVELDGDDDSCEDSDGDDDVQGFEDDDCADFEAPPRFLDLPLDGQPVEAFSGLIPPGTYDELEFEIEDLEDDEEDTQFAAEIEALRQVIQDEFPDWPRKATALVVGSFDAVGGGSTDFRVYIEAEIEIERALQPPLVVDVDGASSSALTVDIRPDLWFARSDGSVLNLSLYDYDETGQLLEFELEMEEGFMEIEIQTN